MVEKFTHRYILQIVADELQTVNVAYFQRKIQLSGFSAYPDGSPSQLIRMSVVLLYFIKFRLYLPQVAHVRCYDVTTLLSCSDNPCEW